MHLEAPQTCNFVVERLACAFQTHEFAADHLATIALMAVGDSLRFMGLNQHTGRAIRKPG